MVSALYAQFDGDNISLSMGGGLGETHFRKRWTSRSILMKGGTIDLHYLENHEPAYCTNLARNSDVVAIRRFVTISKRMFIVHSESKTKNDYGEFILYMEGWLVSTIAEKIMNRL